MLKKLFTLNTESENYLFLRRIFETESISVFEIIKYFIGFSKIILFSSMICGVLAILTSISSSEEYVATSKIIEDIGVPPKADLSALSDLLDIPAAANSLEMGMESFEGITGSNSFMLGLLSHKVYSERFADYVSMEDYLLKTASTNKLVMFKDKILSIPTQILVWLTPEPNTDDNITSVQVDTIPQLSAYDRSMIATLQSKIEIKGNNPLLIQTTFPDAAFTARFNKILLKQLEKEVNRLKNGKNIRDLELLEEKLHNAQTKYLESQEKLANFKDKNRGLISAQASIEYEQLTAEYNLYFGIYSTYAIEVANRQIELAVNKPFYNLYEPAYLPEFPEGGIFSLMSIVKALIIGAVLGVVYSLGYTFLVIFNMFKQKLVEIEI